MPAATADDSMQPTTAARYAAQLLRALGCEGPVSAVDEHPALAWAASGLMSLCGVADGEPQMCPAPLASCADGALAALAALAPPGALEPLRGASLLAERAGAMGLRRRGEISPGGACRLYQAIDGWIALNLPREDDWSLLCAWLEVDQAPTAESLPLLIRTRSSTELVERGRLLGLAVALDCLPPREPAPWFAVVVEGPRREAARRPPRVLELASLWAGPLCGHLLQRMGAEVIKLESPRRPDGARAGNARFFDALNAGKLCVAIDPNQPEGFRQWCALIDAADIVIEGSRPRGLRQLGIDAEALVRDRPGLSWISLSGYGRGEPQEQWVAYGDDAAVAAGLSGLVFQASGQRLVCGDAIADPLAGLHAALAAWACHRQGGGQLISIALRDVVAHALQFDLPQDEAALRRRKRQWTALALAAGASEPLPRAAGAAARPLGADTTAVLERLGIAC
jgi:crotonobetainyl-CoA:carnitine CoA-transferase CaiB-like acyl-CoA transferase